MDQEENRVLFCTFLVDIQDEDLGAVFGESLCDSTPVTCVFNCQPGHITYHKGRLLNYRFQHP